MTPVTTVCHSCATDMMRRPFSSTLMISAPMMVPRIEPRPPASEVPPMTTAAMASNSYPSPSAGCAEFNREAVLEILGRFTEDLQALSRAIRWGEADKLFDLFTRTREIRRGIIAAGQESTEPNFGRDRGKH